MKINTDEYISLKNLILNKIKENCKLDETQKIYRISNFFSYAQAIESGRLPMTNVSNYSDSNEGIDRLVQLLYLSASGNGCGYRGAHDKDSTLKLIETERACRFVSCWSKTSESHAMWHMYSPDTCSIKMQTTVGKLQEVGAECIANDWLTVLNQPERKYDSLITNAEILSAQYANIFQITNRLARRTRLARRIVNENNIFSKEKRKRTSSGKILNNDIYFFLNNHTFFKDQAFSYEDEIRLSLIFSWEKSLKLQSDGFFMENLIKSMGGDNKAFEILFRIMKSTQNSPKEKVPINFFAPIKKDFFESACVDPRSDSYKRDYIEKYLEKNGIKVTKSKSFGLAYDNLNIFPDAVPPIIN